MKYVDHLRQQCDARIERNSCAAQAFRASAAVPMLVQRVYAQRHRFREPQLPRDARAAVAAGLNQLLRDGIAIAHDVEYRGQPFGPACVAAGLLKHETQHLRHIGAHQLVVVLEALVVGEIQLADARGVAAAPEVFQQQRVIQRPDRFFVHAGLAANVHADPAAAYAMALGLSLGQIEGVAQRTQQFSEF